MHKVMHTINGGKLVLEGTREDGKMVPEYLVELDLDIVLDIVSKRPDC